MEWGNKDSAALSKGEAGHHVWGQFDNMYQNLIGAQSLTQEAFSEFSLRTAQVENVYS